MPSVRITCNSSRRTLFHYSPLPGAESESTPLPPVTLLGPGPVPPRQSSALPPQAIPQQPGSVPPPEAPFPTAVRVHQPLQTQALSPQILPSGVLPFIAQDGLAPKRTFTPPGALPLAQPASRREVEVTQPDAVETETPRAIATNTRSSSEGEAVVVSTPSNSLHEGLFKEDASAEQRGDPATAKLGTGLLKEQPLAGRLDELEEDVRSGVPGPNLSGAQEPPADTIGNKASPSAAPQTSLQRQQGQIGSPILPSVQLESPSSDTSALDFSGNRPKSSHGLRNPQSAVLPEEPPLKAQELNPQILAVDSTPPAVETLRTISISRPPPLAQEAPAQPAQPFLSRQPSRTMAYSGGAALTFTCASCNYAQMLPALPPGVHNMRCGTCGSINEVQIAAPPAAVPTPMPAVPPPQMYAGQQGGVYGQQPVSSPGSQGGSYAAPPSPPAQNMRCGACGTLMILPPLEPGVHQLRCGGCQAVNSVHIQPQAVQVRVVI